MPAASVKPLRIGFIGDIMNIADKTLVFGDDLKAFVGECDILIGNFEATIHDHPKRPGVWIGFEQPQAERIVDDLAALFDPTRFYLSLANNHSGDYPLSVFERSNALLRDRGYRLFGMKDDPWIDPDPGVRIVTGTMWSNQRADDMLYLHAPNQSAKYCRPGAVNILYPHWGYELEAWPRPEIVRLATEYARDFDAIVGHHAHNPQQMALVDGKPVAFGLGDFCFYYDLPTYKHGMVCRMEIAPSIEGGAPAIATVDWRQITAEHQPGQLKIEMSNNILPWLK
ncbi:hypothetical protein ASE75_02895 [Sphingomonas sp. Leaf17]|nr:hypothetical protein ASE75_02895 [Sphingomonas sp. Leaf17]